MANIFDLPDPSTEVTAMSDAAATLTTTQLINGLLLSTPTAARTFTTPTATAILADVKTPKVGAAFVLGIRNTSAGAFAVTLAGGTGVTVVGTATTAQNVASIFWGVVTAVDTPAVSLYRMGTGAV